MGLIMANSKTFDTVVTDIRNMLGDNINYEATAEEEAGNTWSTQLVLDAINYAVKDYCKKTKCSRVEKSVTLEIASPPYVPSIPNELRVPSDSLEVMGVYCPTEISGITTIPSGGFLLKTSKELEQMRNEFWEYTVGTKPNRWYMWDSRTIRLLPNVNTSNYAQNSFKVHHLQAPMAGTTIENISVGVINVGQWYQIITTGTTDFSTIGAVDSNVGTQFMATATGSGTGQVKEVVDPRIIIQHQEYLKYCAAAFLLLMNNDRQSFEMSEKYTQLFNSFIGV
jgi:hypothetical protein